MGRVRRWLRLRLRRTPRTAETDVSVRRVAVGSTYVRVSSVGTAGERAFVLVPGIGVSSNYFERLAAELNDFGPVHALDLPGFGGVPHPKGGRMSIPDYADALGRVIDELGLTDPVLIGHSMGTQVVCDLAARYPDGFAGDRPLSSLVLLGPVVNRAERTLRQAVWRFVQVAVREPPRVALLAVLAYALCGVRWFVRVLPEMMAYPIEETLPQIRSNTLVIAGERDTLCPGVWTDEVAELVPSSRVWIIPGAAHSVMHAHAAEVSALAVAHARHPGAGPLPTPEAAVRPEASRADEEAATPELDQVLSGQAAELAGIVTGDDRLIEEGKSQQAEAMEEVSDRSADPHP